MPAVRSFAKSVIFGGLVGAAPFVVFVAFIAAGSSNPGSEREGVILFFRMAATALAISTTVVLVASVTIGLPLTYVLKHRQRESAEAYTVAGAVAGATLPAVLALSAGASLVNPIVFCGAASGAITGRTWWKSARRGASADQLL